MVHCSLLTGMHAGLALASTSLLLLFSYKHCLLFIRAHSCTYVRLNSTMLLIHSQMIRYFLSNKSSENCPPFFTCTFLTSGLLIFTAALLQHFPECICWPQVRHFHLFKNAVSSTVSSDAFLLHVLFWLSPNVDLLFSKTILKFLLLLWDFISRWGFLVVNWISCFGLLLLGLTLKF